MNSQQTNYYLIEKAIHYIDQNFKTQPDLDEIARSVNLSPFHFQKEFKKWVGISPKKFIQFLTVEHTKKALQHSKSILNATFDSGLSSSSRLYDLFENIEAMSPTGYRNNGANLKIYYGFFESPFGTCLIAVTDKGICDLFFTDSKEEALDVIKKQWFKSEVLLDSKKAKPYFDYIFGKRNGKLNLLLKGTNFQIKVWKALLEIPEGSLVSYQDIAKAINIPKSSRAVGTAVGSNPIAYLIPCHRVIKQTGVIGNYRWGTTRKRIIIARELSRIP